VLTGSTDMLFTRLPHAAPNSFVSAVNWSLCGVRPLLSSAHRATMRLKRSVHAPPWLLPRCRLSCSMLAPRTSRGYRVQHADHGGRHRALGGLRLLLARRLGGRSRAAARCRGGRSRATARWLGGRRRAPASGAWVLLGGCLNDGGRSHGVLNYPHTFLQHGDDASHLVRLVSTSFWAVDQPNRNCQSDCGRWASITGAYVGTATSREDGLS